MARFYYRNTILKRRFSVKFLFLISSVSFALSIIWIETVSRIKYQYEQDSLVKEALGNAAKDIRYFEVYRVPSKQSKNVKFILLWNSPELSPFDYLGRGQRAFIDNNCSVTNCYVTTDRSLFGGDVTRFHAIAFNGRDLKHKFTWNLPSKRSPEQKYIFFNMESSGYYPICNEIFDGFFNWTATYRLDSDVPYPYIVIRNVKGDIVGPKRDMHWEYDASDTDEKLPYRFHNKSKAAAWFVSNCSSKSGRKEFVRKLKEALQPHNLNVDVYGSCGPFHCPLDRKLECDKMLERDYYFYMSLENSFAEDYVTEKVLTAVQHHVVPIVYGAANYSRFLPPGSYLDGRRLTPKDLALKMAEAIASPKVYERFFKWKKHYTYSDPSSKEDVCAVCAALNDDILRNRITVYKEFRRWWDPNYENRC